MVLEKPDLSFRYGASAHLLVWRCLLWGPHFMTFCLILQSLRMPLCWPTQRRLPPSPPHTPLLSKGPRRPGQTWLWFFLLLKGKNVPPGRMALVLGFFSVSPGVVLMFISLTLAGIPPNQSRNLSLSSKHHRQHRWGPFLFFLCWLWMFPSSFLKLFLRDILYKLSSIKRNNLLWGDVLNMYSHIWLSRKWPFTTLEKHS